MEMGTGSFWDTGVGKTVLPIKKGKKGRDRVGKRFVVGRFEALTPLGVPV